MGLNAYSRRGIAQQTRLALTPSGTTTITLVRDPMQAEYIDIATGASGGWVLQVPCGPADAGMFWFVNNGSGQTCTIKGYTTDTGTTATTGIDLTSAKKMIVMWNGTDFVQMTADK